MIEVGVECGFEAGQFRRHGVAARLADHIAQEKNVSLPRPGKQPQALFR